MTRASSPYIKELSKRLESAGNREYAAKMKAYLRNQFDFYGMTTQERNLLFKAFWKEKGIPGLASLRPLVDELFDLPEREYQYFGIELARKSRKEWAAESVELFETMAVRRSWWDTVDYVKSACLKDYFRMFPEGRHKITGRWADSDNIWLQRLSVIFQLGYKSKTDTRLLSKNILKLRDSDEFFVQKAIGWALRDYARTDPDFVRSFVAANELKPLSRREAMKHL